MSKADLQQNPDFAGRERRNHLRAAHRIQVSIQGDTPEFDIHGQTMNLSPVGTYCRVDRPIPEMTQLMMVLALPDAEVILKGTVVRRKSDPQHPGHHELAIFFHEMSEEAKARLSALVKH